MAKQDTELTQNHSGRKAASRNSWGQDRIFSVCSSYAVFAMYVALTNIPVGELLTGFAMRSDPNVWKLEF